MLNNNFTIGQCHVMPSEFSIQRHGEEKQSLQPKFIEVLCYLAKHYPRIIPRDELIDNIWGSNSYVGDKSLTNAIWHLRKNLKQVSNDSAVTENNEVIETIRKAGYRLLLEPQWQPIDSAITSNKANNKTALNETLLASTASGKSELTTQINANKETPLPGSINKLKTNFVISLITLSVILLVVLFVTPYLSNEPVKITQITQQPGSELFPAVSPDGRYLVYSQVSNNQPTNLFMQDTWQSELPAKQLTFDNATEGHSVWSNDGQYLYFSRKDKANNSCQYIQLKVSSQQEKTLADCPMSGVYYYVEISADDQTLAFYNKDKSAKRTGIYFLSLANESTETSDQQNQPVRFSCDKDCTYKDRDMAFSPDGKYIAVTRRMNRFNENVFLVNLATKEATQLTFGEEDIVGLTWHSNSNKIIYGALRADVRYGFVIDINTKKSQALNLAGFSYPSFAKKSQQLFYQQRRDGSYLNSLPLNNSIVSSPFPVLKSNFNYSSPDYHEESDLITYGSNESGFFELWSAKTDGSQRKQLTNLKQNIRYPRWSHDGKKIAFLAPLPTGKGDRIYIYSLIDEKVSLLKSPFIEHNRPSWSFDDSKIISAIYGENHSDIYSIDIKSAETKRLTFDSARFGVMISDNILLYTKLKRGLWQKDIKAESSEAPKRIISDKGFNSLYAWSYHDNQVYYHKSFSDHQQLITFNMKSQQSTPLVRLPLNSFAKNDSLAYMSKQQSLLFVSNTYPQTNIKMIENQPLLK